MHILCFMQPLSVSPFLFQFMELQVILKELRTNIYLLLTGLSRQKIMTWKKKAQCARHEQTNSCRQTMSQGIYQSSLATSLISTDHTNKTSKHQVLRQTSKIYLPNSNFVQVSRSLYQLIIHIRYQKCPPIKSIGSKTLPALVS